MPLLLLAAASSLVTVLVQKGGGAMQTFPLAVKVSNAVLSYVRYVIKMFWPNNLSALYPHPESSIPVWQIAGASMLLVLVTVFVIRFGRRSPYLPVGWFWYVGTLVPVIGIVQVGNQAMADRYTYIPLIGLFLILAWGLPDLTRKIVGASREEKPGSRQTPRISVLMRGLWVASLLSIVVLSGVARVQVRTWKDGFTLFQHALEVIDDNYLAEHDLGMLLILNGKPDEGVEHLDNAVRIKPDWGVAYANLAMVHFCRGNGGEAWRNVRLARKQGCEPAQSFLRDLQAAFPESGK